MRFLNEQINKITKPTPLQLIILDGLKMCKELWYTFLIRSRIDEICKQIMVRKLRRKSQINVVFVASFLSQWKYQPLYELMKKTPRFNPIILVAPMRHHEQSPDYFELKRKLFADNIEFIDFVSLSETDKNIRKSLNPDVLFYTQPYYHIYDKRVDSHSFKNKLICYSDYGFIIGNYEWEYDSEFLNRAWIVFSSSSFYKRQSSLYAINKGRNAQVVGYLNADRYAQYEANPSLSKNRNSWKPQEKLKKRIVWTPHFSITQDTVLHQGNFLQMADDMLLIAKKYADQVQFSFKPHPSLYSLLVRHPQWGKERTDAYYEQWAKGENTQLDNGEFIDLFVTSDAIINDSGSFIAEYIYSKNPALNCFANMEETIQRLNNLMKMALKCQYIGSSVEEIERFINDVVLDGHDILYEKREAFYEKYLKTPSGESVTMNIYNSILSAIG